MAKTPNTQKQAEMEPEKSIAVKEIEKWIERVSQVRPELGGFSVCPYAKSGKYKIIECSTDKIEVEDCYDVIIYVIDETDLVKINEWVVFYNKKFENWLFFEDCANYDTFIGGVQTNNGLYNLILAQPKEKLMKFREALKKTDYYSYWSEEYYKEIVGE
jgi:hypothetical protein